MPDRPPITHPFTSISQEHVAGTVEALRKTLERLAGKPVGFMVLLFDQAPPGFVHGHDKMTIATASNLTSDAEEIRLLRDTITGLEEG